MSSENTPLPEPYLQISRAALWGLALALVLFTGLVMTLCMKIDFPLYFAEREVALKVGGTIIDLPTFRQLKEAAEQDREKLSDQAFAGELLDLLLLSEAGRKAGIDRDPIFQKRIRDYDDAMAVASTTSIMHRTLFLFEELAERTREQLTEHAAAPATGSMQPVTAASQPQRLHVRELVVASSSQVADVFAAATQGTPFAELNASWSKSLYAGVGGDRGWNTAQDFPGGVFERLLECPVGSLTFGFQDEQGTHLFFIQARPTTAVPDQVERMAEFWKRQAARKAQQELVNKLRRDIPCYVHPQLLPSDSQIKP